MDSSFNLFDIAFLVFGTIFVATAFFRGVVKECFSLFSWLVAFTVSYFLSPYVTKLFDGNSNAVIIDTVARSAIFFVVLVSTTLFTSSLCKEIKNKVPQSFDRSLGVFYGIIKTLMVFGLIYSTIINAFSLLSGGMIDSKSSQYPNWLRESRSHDIVKYSGEAMNPIVVIFFDSISKDFKNINIEEPSNDLDKQINEMLENESEIGNSLEGISDHIKDSGYSKKDIEKMNRLIEILDK